MSQLGDKYIYLWGEAVPSAVLTNFTEVDCLPSETMLFFIFIYHSI